MSENKIFIFFDSIIVIATLLSLTLMIINFNPITLILFICHIFLAFFFLAITIQLVRDSRGVKNVKKK